MTDQNITARLLKLEQENVDFAERLAALEADQIELYKCVRALQEKDSALASRLDTLEQEIADHETRITHQAVDQVEYLGRLEVLERTALQLLDAMEAKASILGRHTYELGTLATRVAELEKQGGEVVAYLQDNLQADHSQQPAELGEEVREHHE